MKNKKRNDTLIGCLCAVGCEILYGMSFLFTRKALDAAGPFALLGWRFLVAFLVMSLLWAAGVIRIDLKGKNKRPLLVIALLFPVIYFIGETTGIRYTTASECGVFLACIPAISLIASSVFLGKKPSKLQVIGVSVTICGVLMTVFAVGSSSSFSAIGYFFMVIAVLSYAIYSILVEKTENYTGMELTYAMLAEGAAAFIILALMEAARSGSVRDLAALPVHNQAFLEAILYQGIGCSIIAFFLGNAAIMKIGVNRTSSFIGIATVVSVLSGALLLGEPFTGMQMAGAAVILIGVYVANAGRGTADPIPDNKNNDNELIQ